MPQLTLIAATGPSGKRLITRALNEGYSLVLYARSPQKVDESVKNDTRVRIVQGTLTEPDYESLKSAITGSKAVISLLAPTDAMPTWFGGAGARLSQTKAYDLILKAMDEVGVRRFIATGTPSYKSPLDGWHPLVRLLVSVLTLLAPNVPADVIASQVALDKWKDKIEIVWARVTLVTDAQTEEGKEPAYKLGYFADVSYFGLPKISRDSLAKALVDQVESSEWVGKTPAIYQ